MVKLEAEIAKRRNSLKTDRLDMSFGELMNMFEDKDLFISPEYQRVFRWSLFQQTRFIESVLLGIPIPPIFVAEDDDGKWELVDGLQRISTIFAFFGLLISAPDKNNTILTSGELIEDLKDVSIDSLPIKLKTTLKRSVCRVEIVRWDSNEDVRYELFNRLNTGASPLSDQEIRNCIFRAYPIDFNQLLRDFANNSVFVKLISPSKRQREEMFLEELVLRFYAFKFSNGEFRTTVPNYLSEFMRDVSRGIIDFNIEEERKCFLDFITFLAEKFGNVVFRPKGNFALYIYESISYALPRVFSDITGNEVAIESAIKTLLEDEEYSNIGTTTYSTTRMTKRMERAMEIFENA